jgi:hypothetical protein
VEERLEHNHEKQFKRVAMHHQLRHNRRIVFLKRVILSRTKQPRDQTTGAHRPSSTEFCSLLMASAASAAELNLATAVPLLRPSGVLMIAV